MDSKKPEKNNEKVEKVVKPKVAAGGPTEIFVKNIAKGTTEKNLREQFEKFGTLVKCKLNMRNGKSIGTAYVEYEDPTEALEGLQGSNSKRLGSKKIWCEFTDVKGNADGSAPATDTVFCGNIGFYTEEKTICDFFADVGKIIDIVFAVNEDGTNRGFAHLQFENPEQAAAAVKKNGQ